LKIILDQFALCTNRDQKTSLYNAILDHIHDKRALEFCIDILSHHTEEPQLWQKLISYMTDGSAQKLVCAITIVRLSRYLIRHCDTFVLDYYTQMLEYAREIIHTYEEKGLVDEVKIIAMVSN
jgi:hypothetical protein